MFTTSTKFCVLCLFVSSSCADTQVQDRVQGDSTVGGFHLLEIHSGTAELGLKIVIFAGVIGLIVFFYMRYRAKMLAKKRLVNPLLQSLNLNPDLLALAHQQALPLPATAARRPRCHRCRFPGVPQDDEDEESAI